MTFIPPPVEPAHAPMNAAIRSIMGTNRGQFE